MNTKKSQVIETCLIDVKLTLKLKKEKKKKKKKKGYFETLASCQSKVDISGPLTT